MMKHSQIISILSFLLLGACSFVPSDVSKVIRASGENKKELQRAIDYYQTRREKEKLKALYFLIGNLDNKSAPDPMELKKYDPLFSFFKDLRDRKLQVTNNSVYVKSKRDSLFWVLGLTGENNLAFVADNQKIKAEYLIRNIDLAFKTRDSVPWGQKIPFDQFCEYILAFRFNHEPIEDWRQYYFDKYRRLRDTIGHDSIYELAAGIHKLTPRTRSTFMFSNYPYDFLISQLESGQLGTCVQIATNRAQIMRAAGIPTAIDFTPGWGDHGASHYWNSILLENGKWFHYEGTPLEFGQDLVYRVAKVYRKTFGRQQICYKGFETEIPPEIRKDHLVDVTPEYSKTFNLEVPIKYPAEKRKRFAVICCSYTSRWVPLDLGEIKGQKAAFKNMGTGNLYLIQYFEKGRYTPASDPFVLTESGELVFISPGEKNQQMLLLRKVPLRPSIKGYQEGVVGCYFQAANTLDFRNSVILHTITSSYDHLVSVRISSLMKFRYVRYKSPVIFKGDIAEIEFYGGKNPTDTLKLSGKIIGFPEVPLTFGTPYTNAFDGDIDTYFHGYYNNRWWAGLDLGRPEFITKIKYCPRSDTNFIVEGDRYELYCWSKQGWISMGEQVAIKPLLTFNEIPSGGLYLLHNKSRGKEERIFTYKEGKQVFW